jgi:hypothetical protein
MSRLWLVVLAGSVAALNFTMWLASSDDVAMLATFTNGVVAVTAWALHSRPSKGVARCCQSIHVACLCHRQRGDCIP